MKLRAIYFFLLTCLSICKWIDHDHFLKLWQQSLDWSVENLFVEILAPRHVNLFDSYVAFIVIRDLGARVLLYYEHQWLLRHQFPINTDIRKVLWEEYSTQVTSQFYSQPLSNIQQWQGSLQGLWAQLQHPNFLLDVMLASLWHLIVMPSDIFQDRTVLFDRIKQLIG